MAVQAHATAKYVRTSAQKAGLVLDLIRGRDVNAALATLQFARKSVARDIEKVLRSANACYANQGPSQKRIRPAPMGRAFRVVKRTAHLTVAVTERPSAVVAGVGADGETRKRPRGAKPKAAKAQSGAKASAAKKQTAKA
jgi:large subunit ribosomal protein L22